MGCISHNRPVTFNHPQIPPISPGFEPGRLQEELIVSLRHSTVHFTGCVVQNIFSPHMFKFYCIYVLDSLSQVTLKERLTQDVGKTRQNFLMTVKTECS